MTKRSYREDENVLNSFLYTTVKDGMGVLDLLDLELSRQVV